MYQFNIINYIGLDRAKSVNSDQQNLLEGEIVALDFARDFGIDSVYFNTDESDNSYPVVFIKKVESFDQDVLAIIAEVHRKVWNFKKVLFLYVYSDTEIRIYNCSEKPVVKTTSLDYLNDLKGIEVLSCNYEDKEALAKLTLLFSAIALDTGIIWTINEGSSLRKQINLQRRVDKYLVESLVHTANQLELLGLDIEVIHKLILRSLFLLYLEDRGATDSNLYMEIRFGAESYFDILEDVESTYLLFNKLEEHFNGNVFSITIQENVRNEHLCLIKKCFINGNDSTSQNLLFEDWRIFDFSIIQIELLSEIYENFLFKTDPALKKNTGTYYTPPSLVEFILNEKLPTGKNEINYNVKILDPSCGSGIFLVESFKRLVRRYENKHNHKLSDFNILKQILTENIFGIEIHPQAVKVAAFSLYLALVDNLNPKTIWQNKEHRLPNLINYDNSILFENQGNNLFCRDTINKNSEIENIEFDLVVGNPPFGTSGLSESIVEYCNKYKFAKEMVLPFLHKATKFSKYGEIALIFNTKVLTNTSGTYQTFRKWLFQECYVEKIYNFSILRNAKKNFGGQLFGDATGPISIIYYQKQQPVEPVDHIAYYAPKTYIKSSIIDGLSIDSTDIKFLPRLECQNPNTKIWKVAMWGGMNDWKIISKLYNTQKSFESYLLKNKIEFGSGLHPKENEINVISLQGQHVETSDIIKYYTPKENTTYTNKDYRSNNLKLFKHPLVVIKEGITKKRILSSFFDYDVLYNKAVYGFASANEANLKRIALTFNSDLATYFFFLTSSSWGIERDRIVLTEYLNFPYVDEGFTEIDDLIFSDLNFDREDSIFNFYQEKFNSLYWNKKIFESYNLSEQDIKSIQDTLLINVDLFHNQERSIALKAVLKEDTIQYGSIVVAEINDFLFGQNTFVSVTVYNIDRYSPLLMIKLSFSPQMKALTLSDEFVTDELTKLDKHLWESKAKNIFFRKKLNYKNGDDIYLIRPNQNRYWSYSIALEDASELIGEILSEEF